MKTLLNIAWKNLFRHKRRTLITTIVITVGVAMFIMMDSWIYGLLTESERNLINYETSSARILNTGYWEERNNLPLKYNIENPDLIVSGLSEMGIVSSPRTVFAGEIIVQKDPFEEDGSFFVKVFAINPETDNEIFDFKSTIEEGRYLKSEDTGIMMGGWLAHDIGAKVGYPVMISTRTLNGYRQIIDAEIVGIINSPNPFINRYGLFMPLKNADRDLEMGGSVTEINVKLDDYKKAETLLVPVSNKISSEFKNVRVYNWKELAEQHVALTNLQGYLTQSLTFIIFIIAAIGIINTMLMAIYERIREFGILRSLGMSDMEIRLSILFEAGLIGLLGSLIGLILGVLGSIWIIYQGVDFSFLLRQVDYGLRLTGLFRGMWHPQMIFVAFLLGIIFSIFVALLPARKAIKMNITDCLRHQ